MGPVGYRLRVWARARWRATAVLVLVVAIASGAALVLLAGAVRTITAPDRYSSWRGAVYDVNIQQSHGPPRTAEVERLRATGRVDASTFVFGGLIPKKGPENDREPVEALVFAGRQGPHGTRLVDGRLPDAAHPGEFVGTRGFVKSIRARIGDRFDLVTFTQSQADKFGFNAPSPEGPSLHATQSTTSWTLTA